MKIGFSDWIKGKNYSKITTLGPRGIWNFGKRDKLKEKKEIRVEKRKIRRYELKRVKREEE